MASRPKTFATLLGEVVRKGACTFCGACVASCPTFAVTMKDEEPTLQGMCIACQLCYYQCARTLESTPFPREVVEKTFFGRLRDEAKDERLIGVYRAGYAAQSTRDEVLKACQDGGAVTSTMAYALEVGLIECVVATGTSSAPPWKTVPIVSTRYTDLLRTAGTKYTLSPTLVGLMSAIEEYVKREVAVVGVPCQVQALRRIQTSPLSHLKLANAVKLVVGLFCMESYYHDKLMDYLRRGGIDAAKVTRFAIKKGMFNVYTGETEALKVPLKELDPYIRSGCRICTDFSAEFADLSVGGVGVPEGWSLVIARTEVGENLLLEAQKAGLLRLEPLEEVKPGLKSVIKLSETKKTREGSPHT